MELKFVTFNTLGFICIKIHLGKILESFTKFHCNNFYPEQKKMSWHPCELQITEIGEVHMIVFTFIEKDLY